MPASIYILTNSAQEFLFLHIFTTLFISYALGFEKKYFLKKSFQLQFQNLVLRLSSIYNQLLLKLSAFYFTLINNEFTHTSISEVLSCHTYHDYTKTS